MTTISKSGFNWLINGVLPNAGRPDGEGQLLGYRWVQGIFDEPSPPAADTYAYNGRFDRVDATYDPDRNVDELIANLHKHRNKGVRAFSLCLQGGALMDTGLDPPDKYLRGTSGVSAWNANGTMKTAWRDRLIRVLNAADAYGMIVQLQCFYRTRLDVLTDNTAVVNAMNYVIDLLKDPSEAGKPPGKVYRNVIMEVCNELTSTPHTVINDTNLQDTIADLKSYCSTNYPGEVLYWSTSRGSGYTPTLATATEFDYWTLQSGGTGNAATMGGQIDTAKAEKTMPIQVSEGIDWSPGWPKVAMAVETKNVGFFLYDQPANDVMSNGGASQVGPIHSGDGTYTTEGGDYELGYQSPPVNWDPASSPYKTSYLDKIASYAGPQDTGHRSRRGRRPLARASIDRSTW